MLTNTPDMATMLKRVVRFSQLKPVKQQFEENDELPAEAYGTLTAEKTFLLMGPTDLDSVTGEDPVVPGGDGGEIYTVNIASCSPGKGAPLHAHHFTHETFFCLDGRFRIIWGDTGEHHIDLDPYDMIAVPPGVTRGFINLSDKEANLLVLIQGDRASYQDVDMPAHMGKDIEDRFGTKVRGLLEKKGVFFTAGVDVPLPTLQAAE